MPPRQLGLRVALAGLSSYTAGAAAVADSNQNIRQSALDAAQGGSSLDAKTVALGVALGNLATGGIQMALGGLKNLAASLWGMAKEAGPVAGLKMSFEGLAEAAGTTGPKMLAAMRQATGGMAPMKDMMMTFNKGAQLISLDFAKTMPEAMKYLGKVAYATGTDMDYLMNSLVVGVGRMSPMILDNLAIQVKLSDAVARATEMYGIHKDELTKTQQQMGMMSIVLEKLRENTQHMPGVAGSATSAIQSLGAMMKDFRTELGIATLPLLSEWTGVLTKLANVVLPRVIQAVQAVMGPLGEFTAQVGDAADPLFRLADTALSTIGPAFSKMMQSLEPLRDQIGNWVKLIRVRLSSIVDLITGTIGPGVSTLGDFFERAFDRIGQALQRGGNLFLYLLRVVDDVMLGIRNSLKGNGEAAQKNFTEAWQTAIAVVITVLKNAVGAVVSWGKAMVQSYASGIIEGIREYLGAALQAIAGFLRSWMSPGSPPKFLPDIGKWGTGAMNAWLEGMTEGDYDLLAGITNQVSQELSKLVEDGKLKVGDFGKTFGSIRAALMEVTDHFRKTGEVASEKLDVLRDKLGKTGEALAELVQYQLQYAKATEALEGIRKQMQALEDQEYELDKALRPYLDALEELRAKEQDARDEAYELYEAGEIGAEEYEDRIKAIQEEREAAERRVRQEEKAQRAQRTAIRDQKQELTDQERIYQRQAEQLAEELELLKARLGFHQETLSIQDQQKQMAEAMASAMEGAAGAMEGAAEAAKEAGEEAAAMMEELKQAQGGGLLDGLFGGGEDRGEAPKMDFGELLPDVEETKAQVATFFEGLLDRAKQTVETKLGEMQGQFQTFLGEHEWANTLVTLFTEDIPAWIGTAGTALSEWIETFRTDHPQAFSALSNVIKVLFEGDIPGAIEVARQWIAYFAGDLEATWVGTVMRVFDGFKDWWEEAWPVIQQTAMNAWNGISAVVMAFVGVLVEEVWPNIQTILDLVTERIGALGITWGDVWNALKKATGIVAKAIGVVILALIGIIAGLINGIVEGITVATEMWEGMKEAWLAIVASLTETFLGLHLIAEAVFGKKGFGTLMEGLKLTFRGVYRTVQSILHLMSQTFQTFLGIINGIVSGFVDGIVGFFTNLKDRLVGNSIVPDMMQEIKDSIVGKLEETYKNVVGKLGAWVNLGKDLVQSLWDGFQKRWDQFVGWLNAAWLKIKAIWDAVLGKSKPATPDEDEDDDESTGFQAGQNPGRLAGIGEMPSASVPAMPAPAGQWSRQAAATQGSRDTFVFNLSIGSQMDATAFQNQLVRLLNARG